MSYWYASPNGNDSNDGTSFARAKRTIQAAIDLAAPGETVRVEQGAYQEALTINKAVEVVVFRPSKKWGQTLLVGPGAGPGVHAVTLDIAPSDWVRFIGFRFQGWQNGFWSAAGVTGGTLTAMGCWFDPDVVYGINAARLNRINSWSCQYEEQACGIGGSAPLQSEIVSVRGCTFFDCSKCIVLGDAAVLAQWRNCIMANNGGAVRHVELDPVVAFEADYNLYAGAIPSSGYFIAGGVDYSSNGLYDAQWLAFQDIHSPTRNGDAGFLKTTI